MEKLNFDFETKDDFKKYWTIADLVATSRVYEGDLEKDDLITQMEAFVDDYTAVYDVHQTDELSFCIMRTPVFLGR